MESRLNFIAAVSKLGQFCSIHIASVKVTQLYKCVDVLELCEQIVFV